MRGIESLDRSDRESSGVDEEKISSSSGDGCASKECAWSRERKSLAPLYADIPSATPDQRNTERADQRSVSTPARHRKERNMVIRGSVPEQTKEKDRADEDKGRVIREMPSHVR